MGTDARMHRPSGELVCACGLLLLGLFVVGYGFRYPLEADGVVGPGLMPMVCGVGLVAVSAVLVVETVRRPAAAASEVVAAPSDQRDGNAKLSVADFSEDENEAVGKPVTVAGILGLMILCVLLAPVFGLLEMLGLLVFVCVFAFEREGFLLAVMMAVGSALAGWLLFGILFEVPLPYGSAWHALGWW